MLTFAEGQGSLPLDELWETVKFWKTLVIKNIILEIQFHLIQSVEKLVLRLFFVCVLQNKHWRAVSNHIFQHFS